MKYISIYSWEVFDRIEEGKTVHMLDKESVVVLDVNNMSVCNALKWISIAKEDIGRFEFWYVEEQEDKEND